MFIDQNYVKTNRVSSGMGMGNDSATRDLRNKPKNMFFGAF